MKINLKVKKKKKTWLTMFISLIIGFIFNMLKLFDIVPLITENTIMTIVAQVLEFLGLIGVLVDPTTVGIGDSNRAMAYVEPWDDNADIGEEQDQ